MITLTKSFSSMFDFLLSFINVYLAFWLHRIEAELKIILVILAIILSVLRIISLVKKDYYKKKKGVK